MRKRIPSLFARLFGGPASAVFRGMGTLALGTGAARVIGVASIPVLTRIYRPEDYGVMAVFTALAAMLVPVLTLNYVSAIPLPKNDGTAMNLMALSATLILSITLTISVVLWFFGPALLGLMSMEVLVPYWWLIILSILGSGSYELLSMWATRRRAYLIISKTQVTQSAAGEAIKIILGLLAFKPLGLLLGQIAAQSGGIGSYLIRFREDFRRTRCQVNWQRMVMVARYYFGFVGYGLPSYMLLTFAKTSPIFFFAALFTETDAGKFGLAYSVIALPISLLAANLARTFFSEISRVDRSDIRLQINISRRILLGTFLISFPMAITVFVAGPIIVPLILGTIWTDTGIYAAFLSPIIVSQIMSNPITRILSIHQLHRKTFYLNFQRAILITVVFLISSLLSLDPKTTVLAFSAALSIHYFLAIAIAFTAIKKLID